MKTKILICSILMLILTITLAACRNLEDTNNDPSLLDAQESCIGYQMNTRIAESKNSFYFVKDSFLYVIDKNSRKCMPLCSRPDCTHDKGNNDCDAYLFIADGVVNYSDELYFLDEETYNDENGQVVIVNKICKMELDGTSRQDVFKTEELRIWSFKLHRGYIYMLASPYNDDGSANGSHQNLYRVPIGKNGSAELFFEMSGNGHDYLDLRFFGDQMYFLTSEYVSDGKENYHFWRVDLSTGDKYDLNETLDVPVRNLYSIFNEKILFTSDKELYECSLDGSSESKIADCRSYADNFDWYSVISCDSKRLFIDATHDGDFEHRTWIVLDENYTPITVYTLPFKTITFSACMDDSMIVIDSERKELFYIDKTKLGCNDCAQLIYTFEE